MHSEIIIALSAAAGGFALALVLLVLATVYFGRSQPRADEELAAIQIRDANDRISFAMALARARMEGVASANERPGEWDRIKFGGPDPIDI